MREFTAAAIAAICVLMAAPTPARAARPAPVLILDLTAQQQQLLDHALSHISNLESNLKLALDSAGPGAEPPKGSKAKLTKLRLDQARAYVEPAQTALEGLPADDAGVAAARASLDAATVQIKALDDRLAGKTAATKETDKPAEKPDAGETEPAKTPADATVRLDYKQEEQLKNARFHLREVEGYTRALDQLVVQLKGVEDKDAFDHRILAQAMYTIEQAQRKAGFAGDTLKPLPANGAGVAEQVDRLATQKKSITASEAYLSPIHSRLQQIINPANYPDLRADLERIRGLSAMYGNLGLFQTDRPQAAEVFAQGEASKNELIRIAQKYRRLMEQQTDEGKHVEGSGNAMLERYNAFYAQAEQEKQTLPGQIRADMAEAGQYADEAVAEQKPMFFTGGIPQRVEWAEEKYTLYAALDPAGAPAVREELDAFKAGLAKKQKSLEELIIRENPLPSDSYAGGDKKALATRATKAWTDVEKGAKVLAVRFPSEQWKRETMWRYSNGTWYFIDRSRLQAQVIVKHDKKLAVIRPVNLWVNHASNDTMTATPLDGLKDELQPRRFLLLGKVK